MEDWLCKSVDKPSWNMRASEIWGVDEASWSEIWGVDKASWSEIWGVDEASWSGCH